MKPSVSRGKWAGLGGSAKLGSGKLKKIGMAARVGLGMRRCVASPAAAV